MNRGLREFDLSTYDFCPFDAFFSSVFSPFNIENVKCNELLRLKKGQGMSPTEYKKK